MTELANLYTNNNDDEVDMISTDKSKPTPKATKRKMTKEEEANMSRV